MSPEPLDPVKAMTDAIASLNEQVKTRVTSVENGRKYQEKTAAEIAMPNGASIFEATGAWEDYSTPARDFRLLIAIDVVRGYPDHVARRADRYAMPAGKSAADVKNELQGVLASELASRKITYTRSDGSPWTLTLKEVLDRAADFEMAYNPERLRRTALGRARQQRGSLDLQAPRAAGAARQDVVGLSRLVPRSALADAWVVWGSMRLHNTVIASQRVGAMTVGWAKARCAVPTVIVRN